MEKIKLTTRFIETRPAAPVGKRTDFHDSLVPGLSLRVTDRGARSFVLHGRFPQHPEIFTRITLGSFPGLKLDDARDRAREWQRLIAQGKDPRVEEARQKREEAQKLACVLSAVFDDFARDKLSEERKGAEVERDMRRDFVAKFGRRPITSITRSEIRTLIKDKKRSAPGQARNLLGYVKRFFAWAVDEGGYGLETSPCADLKPTKLLGEKPVGERHLSDPEIFALWRASGRLPYPYGAAYRLLTLNLLRLNEVVDAARPEFDYLGRLWTVPANRMKGKNGKAKPHIVPLTGPSLEILGLLPEQKGPFLFSLNGGQSPVWLGDKIKKRLDAKMFRTLRAMARKRGQDPRLVELAPFTNHDIRRTGRTYLSALKNAEGVPIPEDVKEAVLAHVKSGIRGTYDRYSFLDEKFDALCLWAEKLESIVKSKPAQIINLSEIRKTVRAVL